MIVQWYSHVLFKMEQHIYGLITVRSDIYMHKLGAILNLTWRPLSQRSHDDTQFGNRDRSVFVLVEQHKRFFEFCVWKQNTLRIII